MNSQTREALANKLARAKTILRTSENANPYQTVGQLEVIITQMDQILDAELKSPT